ncbi:MAG TPA: type II secretion system protein [Verrucomicrobiae bacterium]|jgi:prepilin-type N-terminal cleavage/methylation domain-containing protein|nr:type II secretion system protein [Verrucomicrobiae bacterium]
MRSHPDRRAFTLIELLVVIAIIGILASLSLVVIARVRERGRETEARRQIQALVNAINEYHSDTGAYPVSDGVRAATAGTNDFTYGGGLLDAVLNGPGPWSTNNAEVIAILLDRQQFPSGGTPTVNFGHVKNLKQKLYLADVTYADSTNLPGVGPDLVYRDPWGNPYVISIDLNYDEKCRDALYEKSSVSQSSGVSGLNGLVNASGLPDQFSYQNHIMIWSLGSDKKADAGPANTGVNRDNIISWK